MAPAQLGTVADYAAAACDILVIESSMGLFDGVAGPEGRSGAGADLAARFGLPVVLILDVSGHSQSAAAVARGFALHRPGVEIAGVVLNRVASERHREGVAAAMEAAGIKIFGAIKRDETITVPERHLGLVQALEHPDLRRHLDRLADLAEQSLDVEGIFALAKPFAPEAGVADQKHCRRRGSASPSRAMLRSASSMPICWKAGAARAARWCFSPRSPTKPRHPIAIVAGCRAAIRNCMRERWRRRTGSRPGLRIRRDAAGSWGVRWVHGAGRDSAKCGWCVAWNGRAAEP